MNGNKLRELREKQGLLQKELANKIGISTSTIGMYEQGRREPDYETLKKFSQYFNVSTDYLLDNVIDNSVKQNEKEINILKALLIKTGFMKSSEDLTDEEFDRLMKFVNANKEFLKESK